MAGEFEGLVVAVTGGASGIGAAIARRLMADGARVAVLDLDVSDPPEGALAVQADVTDDASVRAAIDRVLQEWDRLDVLVNNAGIAGPTGPMEALDPAKWRRCVAVNLDGAFLCARRAVPLLKAAGGGAIVNISSTAGLMGSPLRTPYAAAKWALIGLTRSLAIELGPFGIRVNAICPGSVEGARMARVIAAEATARGVSEEEVRAAYVRTTSMRRFVRPEDIAAMALFLCSDRGAGVSGQAIAVDGNAETLSG
jgi:NAD(P)-dependent dehydrogenase (short-subunit alcohol dehydrogenase family)